MWSPSLYNTLAHDALLAQVSCIASSRSQSLLQSCLSVHPLTSWSQWIPGTTESNNRPKWFSSKSTIRSEMEQLSFPPSYTIGFTRKVSESDPPFFQAPRSRTKLQQILICSRFTVEFVRIAKCPSTVLCFSPHCASLHMSRFSRWSVLFINSSLPSNLAQLFLTFLPVHDG